MNWPPLILAWYPPHSWLKWLFLASESLFFILFSFFFPFSTHTHTHHTTYSGIHWLLVTTQENERRARRMRKRRKTCATIIVGNWTRNLSIGNRLHIPLHHMGHTHTHLWPLTFDAPSPVEMIGYWVGQYLMWRFKSPLLLNALPHAQWKSFGAGGGRRCWWTRLRHSGRSCASRYHSDSGISSERRSPTIVSRQRFFGPCRGLVASSSPNNTCWGIRAASIRATWPSQRRRYSRRRAPMSSGRRALWARSAVLRWRECWSLLETPKMERTHERWNRFRRFICRAFMGQVSAP